MSEPWTPSPDQVARDRAVIDRETGFAPTDQGFAQSLVFESSQLTGRALGWLQADHDRWEDSVFHATGASDQLTPHEANSEYGIPGSLTFEHPITRSMAAYQQTWAQRRVFEERVIANASLNPLQAIGASVGGSVLDPIGLPLWFVPVGRVGELAEAAIGATRLARLGPVARFGLRGAIEGAAGGVAYEGLDAPLRLAGGEHPDDVAGAALTNIVAGGLFGAGLGGLAGVFTRDPMGGHAGPLRRPQYRPAAVEQMSDEARLGGFARALDNLIDDNPVAVEPLIGRELETPAGRRGSPALETLNDHPQGEGRQIPSTPLQEAVAVTTRGTEVPVRYALVELDHLSTSHDDDLYPNPDYPQALQPRERERAGAQARNHALETDLNPKRLMFDTGAETGAPVVGPDGTVESGNGRMIALRRSAAKNGEAWQRYKAELAAQGLPTDGMDKPVLVRLRTSQMTGEGRAALAREMNLEATERLGAAEQARADAAQLDPALLSTLEGGDVTSAGGRRFARAFIQRIAPDQQNSLIAADGALSKVGADRIRAALMAHAYGDPRLVEALFEAADPNIKTIGQALADAAPAWSQMRAAADVGAIPADLDLTPALSSALALIRHARDNGLSLGDLIAERLGQTEMFGGEAISAETEAFLRLFFRDEGFRRQRSADRIASALRDYARRAAETVPGADLFGDTPDGTGKLILASLTERYARDEAHDTGDLLRPDTDPVPPPSAKPQAPAEPVVERLPAPGGDSRGPGGSGQRPDGGGEAQGPGGAGLAPGDVKPGDLWTLSQDQLDALLTEVGSSDHEKLVIAFGSEERAKLFESLQRQANNSVDIARADRAQARLDAEFGNLSPEQERLVYGVGETTATADDIREVAKAHSDVMQGDDPQRLAYMAVNALRHSTPEKIRAVPAGGGSAVDQAAYVRMGRAMQALAEQGVASAEIPNLMHAALVRAGWAEHQATEFLDMVLQDMEGMRRPSQEPARPALGPPARPEPADRGPSPFDWHPSYGTVEHWNEFVRTQTNIGTPARYKLLYGVPPPAGAKVETLLPTTGMQDRSAPAPNARPEPAPLPNPIQSDPELAALHADTEALIAREGLDLGQAALKDDPAVIAEAIRAAAFCIREGGA